jgi:hypothetical protein
MKFLLSLQTLENPKGAQHEDAVLSFSTLSQTVCVSTTSHSVCP